MERPTREQQIEQVLEVDWDCARDDAGDFIKDVILNGYKGLNQMTNDELWEEWKDRFLVCDECGEVVSEESEPDADGYYHCGSKFCEEQRRLNLIRRNP